MKKGKFSKCVRLSSSALPLLLSSCSFRQLWVLNPKGPVAATDLHFMIIDVVAVLFVVIPTTLALMWFMWRYRKGNGKARYDPTWSHSLPIEIFGWGIPLLIVGLLAYFSNEGTHAVDPYNPRVLKSADAAPKDAVNIDVITTDWQWLFIYPKQHIATVDELVVPIHTPVHFRLTSATVVNDFFIPQLVGMIDVMPGMRTKQTLMANQPGVYDGYSADFSGAGFSWMQFKTKVVSHADFSRWIRQVQASSRRLTDAGFNILARPTINVGAKPAYFSNVQSGMFEYVIKEIMMGKTFPTPMAMTKKMTTMADVKADEAAALPLQ